MNERPAKIMIVSNDLKPTAFWAYVQKSNDALWFARCGLDALKYLKEIDYDIDAVVMDLALDDHDGISLTHDIRRNESIRSKARGCLVFWMSEHTINPITLKSKMELKVMEIFTKPLQPERLLERIKGYLTINQAVAA